MDLQQCLQPGNPRGCNSALLSSRWSHPCHQGCFVHESLSKERGGCAGRWQTFIVEAGLVTWLLKSLFSFVCFLLTNSHGTQISFYPVSKGIYLHTIFKTLFSWILQLCPDHSTKPLATFHEWVSSCSFGISPYRQKQTGNYPDGSSAFYWKTSPYAQLTGRLNKNRWSGCGAQKDVLRALQGEEWLIP